MDTPTAISTLQTLSDNLGAQITLATQQKEAVDATVAQLQGVLNTPAADLVAAQTALADEQAAHAADVASLTARAESAEASVVQLQADNATLQAQIATPTVTAQPDPMTPTTS